MIKVHFKADRNQLLHGLLLGVVIIMGLGMCTHASLSYVALLPHIDSSLILALVAFVFALVVESKRLAVLLYSVALFVLLHVFWGVVLDVLPRTPYPLHDVLINQIDQSLGFSLVGMLTFFKSHPLLNQIMHGCYQSLTDMVLLTIILVPLLKGQRFNHLCYGLFLLCVVISSLIAWFYPVAGTAYLYHQAGLFDASQVNAMHHYLSVRAGGTDFTMDDISLPSFHVLLGLTVLISWWRIPVMRELVSSWFVLLCISVCAIGEHYLIDVIASFVVFALAFGLLKAFNSISVKQLAKMVGALTLLIGIGASSASANTLSYVPDELKAQAAITLKEKQRRKALSHTQASAVTGALNFAKSGKLLGAKLSTSNQDLARNITHYSHASIRATLNQLAPQMLPHSSMNTQRGSLYVFISFSMPMSILKAYMVQAIWSGATLVLRGVDPDDKCIKDLLKRIMPLVQFKGAHARIQITPMLFDRYNITTVPTILYSKLSSSIPCQMHLTVIDGMPTSSCLPQDPNTYWKIEGLVSISYALAQFADHGAKVSHALNSLNRSGLPNRQMIKPFKGKWSDIALPMQNNAMVNVLKKLGIKFSKKGEIMPDSG